MKNNNEKRIVTVKGKVRKFKVGDLEINTINESITDEDYEVIKYLLSLETNDMVSLIAKVINFKALGDNNSLIKTFSDDAIKTFAYDRNYDKAYKEALVEDIKFLLN